MFNLSCKLIPYPSVCHNKICPLICLPWHEKVCDSADHPSPVIAWWAASKRDPVQAVRFAKVTRQTIQSTIATNGKVEPVEWATARAVTSGVVDSILVQRGQGVASGQTLVMIDS